MTDQPHTSAARVAGINFRTFYFRGTNYTLSQPLTMGSYAEEESLVLYKRNDPGEFAVKMIQRLPLNCHQGVLNAAALATNGGIPTEEEWTNYGNSMWKKAYMLWTCLDPQHKCDPKTKRPMHLFDGVRYCMEILYAAQLHSDEKLRELEMKCLIVSQEDAIKNWHGPLDQEPGGPNQENETPAETQSTSTAGLGSSSSFSPPTG